MNAPLTLAGVALELVPAGALWWPAERLLAVADLHLEKAAAYAARTGQFLPPYDSRETLLRLEALVTAYQPAILLALGDSFHDPERAASLPDAEAARLAALMAPRRVLWIAGNHDAAAAGHWGGETVAEWSRPPLCFRHAATADPVPGEISGHYHPKVTLRLPTGRRVSHKCFVSDGARLILPAFGALTGGLNVNEIAQILSFRRLSVWASDGARILTFNQAAGG